EGWTLEKRAGTSSADAAFKSAPNCAASEHFSYRLHYLDNNLIRDSQASEKANPMSAISHNVYKKLVLATGRAHPALAAEVAKALDTELLPLNAYDFANGEIYVRSVESVRGKEVFLLQSYPAPLNNWLMEQLIMIDSMKRASARRITVVAPFYPY